jgi:hypothetical protein
MKILPFSILKKIAEVKTIPKYFLTIKLSNVTVSGYHLCCNFYYNTVIRYHPPFYFIIVEKVTLSIHIHHKYVNGRDSIVYTEFF